jgi:hypothetical protein
LIDGRLRLFLHAITSLYCFLARYFGRSENSPMAASLMSATPLSEWLSFR